MIRVARVSHARCPDGTETLVTFPYADSDDVIEIVPARASIGVDKQGNPIGFGIGNLAGNMVDALFTQHRTFNDTPRLIDGSDIAICHVVRSVSRPTAGIISRCLAILCALLHYPSG